MADRKDFLLSSYNYVLPSERIAQRPVEPRHAAGLLIVGDKNFGTTGTKHAKVWDWLNELKPNDLIVLNDTRVLKARLKVRRLNGGLAELLVLEPKGQGQWLCLAKPAKKLRPNETIWLEALEQEPLPLKVISNDSSSGGKIIEFPICYSDAKSIEVLLERYGEVPLPPYIASHDKNDEDRYQTRYAAHPGAVAAPTAGLHLSDELLKALAKKGIKKTTITLHVGLGTFRPVDAEDLSNLQLHSEWIEVKKDAVEAVAKCRITNGRVIAVGTTSVRALEGAASAGDGRLREFRGPVNLVIKPGYRFSVVDGLLTNFHLPKSSLLFLVSALIGRERLLALYEEAIEHQYRFFSYGDAMWIPPEAVLLEAKPRN